MIGREVPFHVAVHYLKLSRTLYFGISMFNVMHESGFCVVPFSLCVHASLLFLWSARELGISKHTVYSKFHEKRIIKLI